MTTKSPAFIFLAIAASLTAFGSVHAQQPTPEDVKKLRAAATYFPLKQTLESFTVTDLKCTAPHADQRAKVVAGYKAMGADADDFVKAYANCSYVVNATIKGRKEMLMEHANAEIKDVKVENDLFLNVVENGETRWKAAQPRRIASARASASAAK